MRGATGSGSPFKDSVAGSEATQRTCHDVMRGLKKKPKKKKEKKKNNKKAATMQIGKTDGNKKKRRKTATTEKIINKEK